MFWKTDRCRFWPRCARGEACPFAHGLGELRSRPNFTKTQMCAGFADGRCKLAPGDCQFAHGLGDLRPEPALPAPSAVAPPAALRGFARLGASSTFAGGDRRF